MVLTEFRGSLAELDNARAASQCWPTFHIDIASDSGKTPINWALPAGRPG
jgi:hypothetical protein